MNTTNQPTIPLKKCKRHVFFKLNTLLLFFTLTGIIQAQQSYTFTSAGNSGSVGPTQAQINSAYFSTNLNGIVTATGGVQFWVIPTTANYSIEATGASGGGVSAGLGAKIKGEFLLTAGDTMLFLVGQMGIDALDGSTTGGGGSFAVLRNATSTIVTSGGRHVTPLIIAGGGGGNPGVANVNSNAVITTSANNGAGADGSGIGGVNGNGGGISVPSGNNRGGGGGGFFTDGDHTGTCGSGGLESGRSFLNGGAGGLSTTCSTGYPGGFGGGGGSISSGWRSSGGGGGYSGGGGGQTNIIATTHRGGGGASYNSGTNQIASVNTSTGHGRIIIGEVCNISLTASGASSLNPSICNGQSLTLTTNAVSNYSWSNGANTSSIIITPSITTVYTLSAMSVSNCITVRSITVVVSSGLPTLSVSSSTNQACLGTTVSLAATGALTYTWSGGIVNGVSFTPSVTSTYTVVGQNGCGTTTTTTSVTVAPLPVVAIGSSSSVCSGITATLSSGGATTYTWFPGNITGPTAIVSPLASTLYTVTGTTGPCVGNANFSLVVKPNPTITTVASSSNVCAGTSVTITAYGASTYTWAGGAFTGPVIVVSPTTPTAINVAGTNTLGCTANVSQVIIANASPNISLIASNTLICLGGSSTLTASGGTNYSWNTGSSNAVEVVSPTTNTVYSVTSTDPNTQCSATQTVGISVFTQTLSVTASTAICVGNSITLNASGGTTYSWSTGSTASSIFVFPVVSTVYTVSAITLTNNMNCESSGSISLTVNPNPTVTAVLTRSTICKGETTTITATGATSYTWSTNENTAQISIAPTANTNYTVTGKNANGCVNTTTLQAKVSSCLGIGEINGVQNSGLLIYPNPSNGTFTIKSDLAIKLNLINELGQTIRILDLTNSNNYEVNISELSNGIYFIVGKTDASIVNQKIVVQK